VQSFVNMAVERHAGIDIFLANAGIEGVLQPITDYPLEVFDQVMAVNVRAVWLGLKYVIPVMRTRGGSVSSLRPRRQGFEEGRDVAVYHQ